MGLHTHLLHCHEYIRQRVNNQTSYFFSQLGRTCPVAGQTSDIPQPPLPAPIAMFKSF